MDTIKIALEAHTRKGSGDLHISRGDLQIISAPEVKIVKCFVGNIPVDICANQLSGLSAVAFFDALDSLIGKQHLYKRSVVLIKAWCYYESRILASHNALLSTMCLEMMVVHICNCYYADLFSPLDVLYRFLYVFSVFDWEHYIVHPVGVIDRALLPGNLLCETDTAGLSGNNSKLVHLTPVADRPITLGILKELVLNCGTSTMGLSKQLPGNRGFVCKYLNVLDPLNLSNNLGRSVNMSSFYRIKKALDFGYCSLQKIASSPAAVGVVLIDSFFSHAWERHGTGLRPDIEASLPKDIILFSAKRLADRNPGQNPAVLPSRDPIKFVRNQTVQTITDVRDLIQKNAAAPAQSHIRAGDSGGGQFYSEASSSAEELFEAGGDMHLDLDGDDESSESEESICDDNDQDHVQHSGGESGFPLQGCESPPVSFVPPVSELTLSYVTTDPPTEHAAMFNSDEQVWTVDMDGYVQTFYNAILLMQRLHDTKKKVAKKSNRKKSCGKKSGGAKSNNKATSTQPNNYAADSSSANNPNANNTSMKQQRGQSSQGHKGTRSSGAQWVHPVGEGGDFPPLPGGGAPLPVPGSPTLSSSLPSVTTESELNLQMSAPSAYAVQSGSSWGSSSREQHGNGSHPSGGHDSMARLDPSVPEYAPSQP